MIATMSDDLRDRAILLLSYSGGLRRSEIVSLDAHKDDTPDSGGRVEIGRGATGERLQFGRIDVGPIFEPASRDGMIAFSGPWSQLWIGSVARCWLGGYQWSGGLCP